MCVCLHPCAGEKGQVCRVLVEEFNSMYVEITKDTLKPKFHFLIHYSLLKFGTFLFQMIGYFFVINYFVNMGFDEHINTCAICNTNFWCCMEQKDDHDPLPLYSHEDTAWDKCVVLRYCLRVYHIISTQIP